MLRNYWIHCVRLIENFIFYGTSGVYLGHWLLNWIMNIEIENGKGPWNINIDYNCEPLLIASHFMLWFWFFVKVDFHCFYVSASLFSIEMSIFSLFHRAKCHQILAPFNFWVNSVSLSQTIVGFIVFMDQFRNCRN